MMHRARWQPAAVGYPSGTGSVQNRAESGSKFEPRLHNCRGSLSVPAAAAAAALKKGCSCSSFEERLQLQQL